MNKLSLWSMRTAILVGAASLLVTVGHISPFVTAAAADGSQTSARAGSWNGPDVGEVIAAGSDRPGFSSTTPLRLAEERASGRPGALADRHQYHPRGDNSVEFRGGQRR